MEVSKPTCETCKYSGPFDYHGHECRAKPPTYDYKNPYKRFFPMVSPHDWCAKYKLNEELAAQPEAEPEPSYDYDQSEAKKVIEGWVDDDV